MRFEIKIEIIRISYIKLIKTKKLENGYFGFRKNYYFIFSCRRRILEIIKKKKKLKNIQQIAL